MPYPGVLNPVSQSLVLGFLKMIIGYGLRFLSFLGKKIVFYVYDLPIEQNIFVHGKCPKEKFSRIIEKMFLSSASFLLVFNKLNVEYLNRCYGLNKVKFEYFEILDYGLNISTSQERKEHSKGKNYSYLFGKLYQSKCTESSRACMSVLSFHSLLYK
jgi:hypothetical protein